MPFLKTVFVSSALALTALLTAGPTTTNALATPAAHVARNIAGVSPSHQGIAQRKRNDHKNRKRCVAQNAPAPPPVVASSSNPAPAPAPSPNTPPPSQVPAGGPKRGLAWAPDVPSDYIINAVTAATGYVYNWSAWAPNVNLGSARFVPMFWGPKDNIPGDFEQLIRYGQTNYGVAIGMNEVNQAGQAQMDPGYGAQLWRQYMTPLRAEKGYRIGSPSTTNDPSGIQWMQQWMGQLGSNEYPDFMCLHWYGIGAQTMIDYLNQFHNTFPGQNIWVTEFACNDFSGQQGCGDYAGFMNQVTSFMDSTPWVEAYFAFGWNANMYGVDYRNQLIDPGSGQLTALGWQYVQ